MKDKEDRPKYVFGPVPSRRLGRSLGVDPVPLKTCTYDCIYCQLGRTLNRTVQRSEYVPLPAVLEELRQKLAGCSTPPDYVTVSGSGEPTLYSRLGDLIHGIREITRVPVAVLTNGSLLWDPEVRAACAEADLVMPSLDAGDEGLFQYINRPHECLEFARVVEGLTEFREEYRGHIWLEVFLLAGINAIEADVRRLKAVVERISPEKIQLNTAIRPSAQEFAVPVAAERLEKFRLMIGPKCEIIAAAPPHAMGPEVEAQQQDVLDLLRRRPCSVLDVAAGLSIRRNEAAKHLNALEKAGLVQWELRDGVLYYKAHPQSPDPP
jgi:wyosine [tRNA(Phe)-imidazoG37] synthetase (radical SAM superfamily)